MHISRSASFFRIAKLALALFVIVLPAQHSVTLPAAAQGQLTTFLPLVLAPQCDTHTAYLGVNTSAAEIQVGQPLTVTVTLINLGCLNLGLPQYSLRFQPDPSQSPLLTPVSPSPVTHYLAVAPETVDRAEFVLRGTAPGQVFIQGHVSFEVHIGYPGPAYWGAAASIPIPVTITSPTD